MREYMHPVTHHPTTLPTGNWSVGTNISFGTPPPPHRPTAVGTSDPFDDIFAAIDRLNGAEFREFLSRIRERYTLDR